jgi:hypothetical protein
MYEATYFERCLAKRPVIVEALKRYKNRFTHLIEDEEIKLGNDFLKSDLLLHAGDIQNALSNMNDLKNVEIIVEIIDHYRKIICDALSSYKKGLKGAGKIARNKLGDDTVAFANLQKAINTIAETQKLVNCNEQNRF